MPTLQCHDEKVELTFPQDVIVWRVREVPPLAAMIGAAGDRPTSPKGGTLKLPPATVRLLRAYAKSNGLTIGTIVTRALDAFLGATKRRG